MVAFNCGRRKSLSKKTAAQPAVEMLAAAAASGPLDSLFAANASHRADRHLKVSRGPDDSIIEIRIGRWRVLTEGPNRRLAEVHPTPGGRVAVRIERFADCGAVVTSQIWQLYDRDGRLDASIQSSPDGRFALLTNYRTREACRLSANAAGELQCVETWRI
jgi:hypothetical protein